MRRMRYDQGHRPRPESDTRQSTDTGQHASCKGLHTANPTHLNIGKAKAPLLPSSRSVTPVAIQLTVPKTLLFQFFSQLLSLK